MRAVCSAAFVLAVTCWTVVAAVAQPKASSLTLKAAVAEALERSPQLADSEMAVQQAEVRRDAARAAFGVRLTPTLASGIESLGLVRQNLGVGLAKRLQTGAEVTADVSSFRYAAGGGDQRDLGLSFRVSQPLLAGLGRVARAEVQASTRLLAGARRGAESAQQQLVLSVADAFYNVLRQERVLEASRQALARATALGESTSARASAGLATELDVMRARLLATQAQEAIARDEEALDTARDRLRHLLARPPDVPLVLEDTVPSSTGGPGPVDWLVTQALDRRVEVLEARTSIENARLAADVARWQVLPPLALDVGYSRRSEWAGGPTPWSRFDSGWFVSITSGTGLSYGASRAVLRSAALAVRAAEQRARDVESSVALEVRAAARAVERSEGTIALADEAVGMARRQRELVDVRYQRGLATSLDLVDAESMLYQTETAAISARIEHALAGLVLERASGTLDPAGWAR